MSHPDHELSPAEHQLSQDVLEFLIAHQDWFMLDTPPPPAFPPTPARSLTPPISPYDASARTSVSDGEGPDGWRIIQRHQRTAAPGMTSRSGQQQQQQQQQQGEKGKGGGASPQVITRSRTLPSSHKGRPATADGSSGPGASAPPPSAGAKYGVSPAVLRKARRASVQPG